MNGFIAERKTDGGKSFWVVRDVNTKAAIAIGDTVTHAVENYELHIAREKMEKELGYNSDAFDI